MVPAVLRNAGAAGRIPQDARGPPARLKARSERGTSEEQGMSGGAAPLIAIALRDGAVLRVEAAGVRLGDQLYELARIQDARQVAPDPETFALRVAGSGLVEFH